MAAAVAPSALALNASNGVHNTEQQLTELAKKLTTLRNDIVAGSHPRLKLPARTGDKGRPMYAVKGVSVSSLPGLSNGMPSSVPSFGTASSQVPPTDTLPKPQNGQSRVPQHTSRQPDAASGLNPIFLEKSSTLVKAEAQVKRERLEHVLEEQAQQKKLSMKYKTHDEFAMPEFSIDNVLKDAQKLVQPLIARRHGVAFGGASSTDSFDENTFYSSQMNESTSTEGEVIEEPKRHVRPKLCRFYLNDKPCPYGENCQFSHDPALRAKVDGSGPVSNPRDLDGAYAREGSNSRNKSPAHFTPKKGRDRAEKTSQQQRIAQLEAELQAMKDKEAQQSQIHQQTTLPSRTQAKSQPTIVGADEFGRDMSLRDEIAHPISEMQQQDPPTHREHSKNDRKPTSPSSNNVRVVRNHITSPYAPQPARVSPLAVAKVPQLHQTQVEGHRTSRIPYAEVVSDDSPNIPVQPLNSRKRRRGLDSVEQNRNVVPRHDPSPHIRIKDEPISPPPLPQAQSRRMPGQDAARTPYIDATRPTQERIVHEIRNSDRPDSFYEAAPLGPPVRRVVSRNAQHHFANDDPDLRRVVSERQIRVPISPAPRYAPSPHTEPRIIRTSSRAYESPTNQRLPVEYRSSNQPQTISYGRSPSPIVRQVSSRGPSSAVMAPPPRRVLVDQYGNEFLESEVRQISVAPINRPPVQPHYDHLGNTISDQRYNSVIPQVEPRYERQRPRVEVIRNAYVDEESGEHIVGRQTSPASQYVEYSRPIQVIERRDKVSGEGSYTSEYPNARLIYQGGRPDPIYESHHGQREGSYQFQNLRPMDDHYERISRIQSVQPQPRIVQISERQPMSPVMSRQVSLRPSDSYARTENVTGQHHFELPGDQVGAYYRHVPESATYEPPRRF